MDVWQLQQYADGIVRKRPLLLNTASVSRGSVPSSFFHCRPKFIKKKVANLAQQYRAAFTLPFCAWQVRFHSDKLASVLRPKQRKRESGLRKLCEINGKCHLSRKGKSLLATIKVAVNYRNCQVEELWSCGVPMVFMYHNPGSVSITRQGNFYYETSVKRLHFKPLFLI